MKLIDDSGSEDEEIKLDEEYVSRLEHNKKREDLHRYEELKKKGLVPRRLPKAAGDDSADDDSEDSSSSEDDEAVAVSKKKDLKFFENLLKIRKKDPALKSKDTKLFDSESEEEDGDKKDEKKKKTKPAYLKDVLAKQLIEGGPDFKDDDVIDIRKKPTYNEEQEELRKAFLDAVEGDNDEDLLTVKKKNGVDPDESGDEELQKKVDEYFDEEDEDASFLKDFFMKKMWVDKGKEADEDDLEILSEDDKEIEKQEEYEYRFQENVGDQVWGHAREVEGTVRKTVKARKEQRKRKEERMELARLEREEELRHLKNLKKKEMNEKIKKIMKTAGIDDGEVVPLNPKELEQEFDPEEYDRMMKKAFGENYYGNEDVDGVKKPDFDAEDELLGLHQDWDDIDTGDKFLAARERSLKHKVEISSDIDEDEDEEEVSEEVKQERRRKSAILKKAYDEMMDEYHKLDCESTIGDLKTRFPYAKVKANRYGLNSDEMNVLDDKELNQYVSMKKIAPYVDREWKVPNSTRHEMKMKAREKLRHGIPDEHKLEKEKKKRRKRDLDVSSSSVTIENDEAPVDESSGQASNLSRSARRRKKRADLKPANTRLEAYGKITSKPKKKSKH